MYSLVLMAALVSGNASQECCFGSRAYYGCGGCYGGCYGGGYGGCYGGGYGCFGSWGAGYGGGCYGGTAYGVYGCYGCYGGWSCYGNGYSCMAQGVFMPTAPMPPAKEAMPVPKMPDQMPMSRAKVLIEVPAQAKLFVDDQLMPSKEGTRTFVTPPLSSTDTYYYDVKIVQTINGRQETQTTRVVLRAGDVVAAQFPQANASGIATASIKR